MPQGTPIIKSKVADADLLVSPGAPNYSHPAERRTGVIPFAFQVTSPFDSLRALLPHAMVMHVNPASLTETHTKKIERIQTRGGFVEQHWHEELDEISADGTTGAFMNLYTGLTSVLRQKTIAWDRFSSLLDLFHSNGSVYNPQGQIVLQGQVMVMFDRGIYVGYFRTFEVEETDESPFTFRVNWSFKVTKTLVKMAGQQVNRTNNPGTGLRREGVVLTGTPSPAFQGRNN